MSAYSSVDYLVEIVDSRGEIVQQVTLSSSSCSGGVCSMSFPTSGQYCTVSVRANSTFRVFATSTSALRELLESTTHNSVNTIHL